MPPYPYRPTPRGADPDADWLREATLIPASRFSAKPHRCRFIPSFPLEFLKRALPAGDAFPVLLIALAEMRMRGVLELSLGPVVWATLDCPSRRVRARLLRQIAALPEELCTLVKRTGRPYLLKAGPAWPRAVR